MKPREYHAWCQDIDEAVQALVEGAGYTVPPDSARDPYYKACWLLAQMQKMRVYLVSLEPGRRQTFEANMKQVRALLPKLREYTQEREALGEADNQDHRDMRRV